LEDELLLPPLFFFELADDGPLDPASSLFGPPVIFCDGGLAGAPLPPDGLT